MANRLYQQFQLSLEKQVVNLFAAVSFGSTGAPTMTAANSKGIASIVRNSAGRYTVTLQDSFYKFLSCQITQISPSAAPAAGIHYVVSQAVTNAAAPTIVVQFTNSTGVATDPASGESATMHIIVGNSSAY